MHPCIPMVSDYNSLFKLFPSRTSHSCLVVLNYRLITQTRKAPDDCTSIPSTSKLLTLPLPLCGPQYTASGTENQTKSSPDAEPIGMTQLVPEKSVYTGYQVVHLTYPTISLNFLFSLQHYIYAMILSGSRQQPNQTWRLESERHKTLQDCAWTSAQN